MALYRALRSFSGGGASYQPGDPVDTGTAGWRNEARLVATRFMMPTSEDGEQMVDPPIGSEARRSRRGRRRKEAIENG